jgi:hypothetical protein
MKRDTFNSFTNPSLIIFVSNRGGGGSVFTVETEHFRSCFVQEDQAHAEIGLTCLMCMDINMYKTLELSARDNTTRTVAQPEDFTSHLSANPFQ